VSSTTVLVIAGIRTRLINRGLAYAAAQSAPNGTTLNVFDGLAYLPRYSEAPENQRLPRSAAALRNAATEAHAAIVLTHYYGHIPTMVHDAIEWLLQRWNQSAIHDKPLTTIGPAGCRYKGVWSRHQTEDSQCITETRVIEPITVTTLHETVKNSLNKQNLTRATKAASGTCLSSSRSWRQRWSCGAASELPALTSPRSTACAANWPRPGHSSKRSGDTDIA
jgi:NAD(P)H-dependent FMN reductase